MVFQQGDLGDSVYVIEDGECDVLQEKDGAQKLLATLKAGDYFGEMALLSDQSRNATIQARTAMNVLIIPKGDFDKLRHSVPAFGEIFRALAKKRGEVGPTPSSAGDPLVASPSNTSDSAGT